MKVLSEEEKQKFVDCVIEWKKNTSKDWDFLQSHAYYESCFADFRAEDEESYFHYLPEIFRDAKNKIEQQSRRNGISSTKENWLWIENIKNSAPWKNFCKMMRDAKWSEKRLETVQKQSLEIVNNLTNPRKLDTPKDLAIKKGLVYGNVQSGKTAHIATLIAMYASAGCNMIIVFSGVTKNLRNQTQKRLRHDLGMDQYHCYDLLTDQTDLLSKQTQGIEGRYSPAKPVIGIFKKSPSALKRLLAYLNRINDKSFWNKKPVLIIDDECDQYSINVAPMKDEDDNDIEFERSTINSLLVQISNTFERYCFVGFTATPFANVLNELPGKDSFYPRDFIYPLELNEKYFGAKKLFGSALENPDKNYEYMDSINIVEEEEISPKLNDFSQIPESLKEAIYYFITATACKYYRGMENEHSSMLVHLDMKIAVHSALKKSH